MTTLGSYGEISQWTAVWLKVIPYLISVSLSSQQSGLLSLDEEESWLLALGAMSNEFRYRQSCCCLRRTQLPQKGLTSSHLRDVSKRSRTLASSTYLHAPLPAYVAAPARSVVYHRQAFHDRLE
jgi:hypothetical protein